METHVCFRIFSLAPLQLLPDAKRINLNNHELGPIIVYTSLLAVVAKTTLKEQTVNYHSRYRSVLLIDC